MIIPILISSVLVLSICLLYFLKPNAGRIFLGFFYLVMAFGVNGSFTFGNPQAYIDYASSALIPLYRSFAVSIVSINPFLFGLLLMAFEISMGLLLLHRKQSVKIGLLGCILFVAGIAPLSWLQVPWLGLIAGKIYLLRMDFDDSLGDILRYKLERTARSS